MASPSGIRNTLDILENQRLYCALPSSFNDPFECRVNISFKASEDIKNKRAIEQILLKKPELSKAEAIEQAPQWWKHLENKGSENAIRIVRDSFRVCSFSARKPDDILMWSHYAGGHNGICLEYRVTQEHHVELFARANEVNYQKELPKVNFYTSSVVEKMHAYVLTKSTRWTYEDERRIIISAIDEERFVSVPSSFLSTVILGVSITEENRRLVLDRIAPKVAAGTVRVLQAKVSSQAYELVFSQGQLIKTQTASKSSERKSNDKQDL